MHILTGNTGKKTFVTKLMQADIGRMFSKAVTSVYTNEKWGFDNGAYISWSNDTHWDGEKYLLRVERAYNIEPPPYMAVIPDKPTQPDSMDFSLYWLDVLPQDLNWYFALQENMSYEDVEEYICSDPRIKGLFLGGTHRYKETFGEMYLELAHKHGKLFHYARTSSMEKLIQAKRMGCDSVDSSFFLFETRRLDAVCEWVLAGQPLP